MLHRLVTLTVVVSLLGFGLTVAWAAPAPEQPVELSAVGGHGPERVGHEGSCDHGCHVSAHLIALTASFSPELGAGSHRFAVAGDLPLTTIDHCPPREPPRL